MGLAALKLDTTDIEPEVSDLVHLMPANTDEPPAPGGPLALGDPKTDLPRLLGVISKVASMLAKQRDRASVLEKRCQTAEGQAKESDKRVSELEARLKAALEETAAERTRAADAQKRSTEIVERSRAMLGEASERLRSAETRAKKAETHFATVREALERQFGRETA